MTQRQAALNDSRAEPVWIWEKPGTRRGISNLRAAAEWLLFFWPKAFLKTDALGIWLPSERLLPSALPVSR